MERSERIFTVPTCPRCEQEHVDLEFERLGSPVAIPSLKIGEWVGHVSLELWAMCPAMAEPILGRVMDTGEVEVR